MRPVNSSNVASVGYSPSEATLAVTFKSAAGAAGSTYHYHGISPEQHANLMRADSVGRHLNQFIKPHAHKIERV